MESAALEDLFSGFLASAISSNKREEDTRAEADYIQDLLQLKPGAKVLDVPCGGGRIALELASRGYQVTGIDISNPLLEEAKRKAAERQLNITWEHRDMRDLPWPGEFDGIFCFWESLGYFDDDGNRVFLDAVYRALKPGGRFLVDTHISETVLPGGAASRDWTQAANMLVLEQRSFDHEESRLVRRWIFVQDGQVEQKTLSIRIYGYRELCTLLRSIGFTSFEAYGHLMKQPFKFGMPRLNLVAIKGQA
jgi:SAM-dependent methyltransferase